MLVDDGGTNPSHTQVLNQASPPLADISLPDARRLVQLGRGTQLTTVTVMGHAVDSGTSASDCWINSVAIAG